MKLKLTLVRQQQGHGLGVQRSWLEHIVLEQLLAMMNRPKVMNNLMEMRALWITKFVVHMRIGLEPNRRLEPNRQVAMVQEGFQWLSKPKPT